MEVLELYKSDNNDEQAADSTDKTTNITHEVEDVIVKAFDKGSVIIQCERHGKVRIWIEVRARNLHWIRKSRRVDVVYFRCNKRPQVAASCCDFRCINLHLHDLACRS